MIGALGLIGGKYRLVRELGRGAFGAVYAARLEPSGEPVALKILARFDQGRSVERFKREIAVATRIPPHPNVVRVLESGEHGGLPYVVMELIQGGSLAGALRDGRRPTIAQAARIAEQVAQGLEHLHRSGVVHRDVNANNVLIDEAGNVRLVDFGLALDQQRVTRITETGELLGTPLTFAPEQLDGKHDVVGAGADIYATAALLYELVTGHSPFQDSKSFRELAHRIRTELPPPADELNPQVPRGLARAVELGLSKRPEDRPRSAAEFAKLIRDGLRVAGQRTSTNTSRAQILGEGPRQIGPYEILLPLGRGRRGMIYSARTAGREAALRVLAVAGDLAGAFAQYIRVVEALSAVSHPNVVASYEAGIEEGYGYAAYEIVRGETLRKVLERERKIEPRRALEIVGKLARGVAACHERRIFHGDIRAEEIIIDPQTGPKLGDFMLEVVLSRTKVDLHEGKTRDIQALGALLLELVTGRRLAGSAAARLESPLDRSADPHARLAVAIALKALDKHAQLRQADALQLAQECERAARRIPILLKLGSWLRASSPEGSVERARLALLVVAAALLVVAGVAARGIVLSRRAQRGVQVLDEARQAVRAGAPAERVVALVDEATSLLGDDEARLIEAGRILLRAGQTTAAGERFARASRAFDSLEALSEENATEARVQQCWQWAGDAHARLAGQGARARSAREGLLVKIADARVKLDRGLPATTAAKLVDGLPADGSVPEVRATRALLQLEAGRPDLAENEAKAALDALAAERDPAFDRGDPRTLEPLFVRAVAREQTGHLAPAEKDLDELLVLAPNHARALAVRALVRARRGRQSAAREDLAKSARALADADASAAGGRPSSPPAPPCAAVAWVDHALAAMSLGDLVLATESIGRATALDRRSNGALVARGAILARKGALDEALRSLDEAVALDPPRADLALLERARVRRQRGSPGDATLARPDLDRALALNPQLAFAHLELARLDLASNEPERAIGRLEQGWRLAPWASLFLREIARANVARGEPRAAITALNQAVNLEPEDPENRAARALFRLDDRGQRDNLQAIEDLDVALALEASAVHPERAHWYARRGIANLERNARNAAIADLTRALAEGGEGDAWIYAARARAFERDRRPAEALQDIERAIDLEKRSGGPNLADYEKRRRELMR